jgi:formylglycine-generating enzyme required for sulfatase activity
VSTKVFINYRRSGDASRHVAGRIYDRLCQDLGKGCVFIDVDKIPLGRNFVAYLDEQIAKCDYVLAVIGPAWLDVRNERGQRRLDDPKDWVRIELAAALGRGIPVVPVLVDGGQLPAEADLPEGLKELPLLQALTLTERGFHHELDRLVGEIKGGQEHEGARESRRPTEPTKPANQGETEPDIIVSPKGGIELVRIAGGRFLMGAPESEVGSGADERPQHWVTLSTFRLGRFPVTNEQYGRYLAANPRVAKPQFWKAEAFNQPRQPVVGVSWDDASAFAQWAALRLPTEAEWEYACRAGSLRRFCWGEESKELDEVGWHQGNSGGRPHAVGALAPNAWGLFDMHGNVFEWCSDWYDKYPVDDDQANPTGPVDGLKRVLRGGSWCDPARRCRAALRGGGPPDDRGDLLGFRLASDR